MTERCGTCTRCLKACPTQAFAAPFVLDARRCVAYLTIEHRTAIPSDLSEGVGTHLFGCDDCQTTCPFNGGALTRAPPEAADGDPFAPLERWSRVRLEDFLSLDEAGWRAICEGCGRPSREHVGSRSGGLGDPATPAAGRAPVMRGQGR
jgi:epoxyqueuosine reductase